MPANSTRASEEDGTARASWHKLDAASDFDEPSPLKQDMLSPSDHRNNDKKKKKKSTKRFCCWTLSRRNWWLAIGGIVLLCVVVALILVFTVIGHSIAQGQLDRAELQLNFVDLVHAPTDPAVFKLDVLTNVHITYKASVKAKTDALTSVLSYKNQTFGSMQVPAQQLESGRHDYDLVVNGTVDVTNTTVFDAMSQDLLMKPAIKIQVAASVTARVMGISFSGLQLHRELFARGMSNFQNPQPVVTSVTIPTCNSSVYILKLNTTINNPSQCGLGAIGQLNLSVYYENDFMGYATLVSSSESDRGLPRGTFNRTFEAVVPATSTTVSMAFRMTTALLQQRAQFYIVGDTPTATDVPLFQSAVEHMNMSFVYTNGFSNVQLGGDCSLSSLLSMR